MGDLGTSHELLLIKNLALGMIQGFHVLTLGSSGAYGDWRKSKSSYMDFQGYGYLHNDLDTAQPSQRL
jgi:hypothetical protein